ncbi:hypothetical protein BT96DRAFT_244345 [Gymnopus androsaceus JB14]|uniref:ATP-dependent RNA helicase DHX29-like UBA domain-containing protein n=1 Tax=Gymnopus androsaceus JB14 TaxID=1447944 RepID=A0A6A4IRR2_9AGAR|nr:hypothetical protein BT96DRAFT_244345 [Gymnopus androsaceus JB14]
MAKKKKTQLKPVARGFATTSVPKKVVEAEVEDTSSAAASIDEARVEEEQVVENGNISGPGAPEQTVQDEFDEAKIEEQSLQNLVDKYQEKTEKEIVRSIKAIEIDRRFSKTLPSLELDPLMIDRILDLAKDFQTNEGKKTLDETEEKAVTKLAITYGVLRRLGFTEERVEECLVAINGVELEEAYEWLYMNCTEVELAPFSGNEEPRLPATPNTPKGSYPKTPRTPRTPAEFLAPPSPPAASKKSPKSCLLPVLMPMRQLLFPVGARNLDPHLNPLLPFSTHRLYRLHPLRKKIHTT